MSRPAEYPSHVVLGDERITWEEYECRVGQHFLSDITNAMVWKKMCKDAGIDIVEDEVEGWCLRAWAFDDEVTEEHLIPACDEDRVSRVVQMAERFRARNGTHEPTEPRRRGPRGRGATGCDGFRRSMGLLCPAYEKERLKWN